jgi:hypothetical protein
MLRRFNKAAPAAPNAVAIVDQRNDELLQISADFMASCPRG